MFLIRFGIFNLKKGVGAFFEKGIQKSKSEVEWLLRIGVKKGEYGMFFLEDRQDLGLGEAFIPRMDREFLARVLKTAPGLIAA